MSSSCGTSRRTPGTFAIATGVPAPTVVLRAGDTVEITIQRLGTLRNHVVATAAEAASQ